MERIIRSSERRKKQNLLRTLHPASKRIKENIYFRDKACIDLSSNDYLGLSAHPALKDTFIKAAKNSGISSSASRLLSGDSEMFHILEAKVASFKKTDASLIFNTGYQANIGIISALFGKKDAVFSDKLNHSSIIDGILLSRAKMFRFRHNDTSHLEYLLQNERHKYEDALIITESVFSMDGDLSPLDELAILKDKYGCKFMVDEAHATGIFGESGAGLSENLTLRNKIDIIMGTFSKALGSFGAYVACSSCIKKHLINASRGFIYSTALPLPVIAANIASLGLIKKEPFRRKSLLENSACFRDRLKGLGLDIRGCSQIIPMVIGDSEKTVLISEKLQEKGYWALPIRPPTVPRGEARIRFSLNYYHKKDMLEKLVDEISDILHKNKV